MRLAKFLANAGVASRRAAEKLVAEGLVSVNGEVAGHPALDVSDKDDVRYEGRRIRLEGVESVVYMLNKPLGIVSTAKDPQGRPIVVDLIPSEARLYPVGRLDRNTSGLILLTNNGELSHRLTHPSFKVPKTYRAKLANPPVRESALNALRKGVELDDGMTSPAEVRRITADVIELIISEGRKRQVRRMCLAVGHKVLALERIALGPLKLSGLARGEYRKLGEEEVEQLMTAGR